MPAPEKTANRVATVVLFVTILLVSLALAVGTDLHGLARMGIAVTTGVLAAALTSAQLSKRV